MWQWAKWHFWSHCVMAGGDGFPLRGDRVLRGWGWVEGFGDYAVGPVSIFSLICYD